MYLSTSMNTYKYTTCAHNQITETNHGALSIVFRTVRLGSNEVTRCASTPTILTFNYFMKPMTLKLFLLAL